MRRVSFDRIARAYRWMEYVTFLHALERCRFAMLPEIGQARRALVLGDGDGRFLARLLATYPHIEADAVDSSGAMLRLAKERVAKMADARGRVRFHQADAVQFTPRGEYDLIVTHFFLDCLGEAEIAALLEHMHPHCAPRVQWIVSEFAVPNGGLQALLARMVIAFLYFSFGVLTGLRTRRLPDYPRLLARYGFRLHRERTFVGGLLRSELWERP